MFTDFVCFQIYFRDYVAQSCLLNGTAYICFSIMDCHEMRRDVFLSTAQLSVLELNLITSTILSRSTFAKKFSKIWELLQTLTSKQTDKLHPKLHPKT